MPGRIKRSAAGISIHALLAESDAVTVFFRTQRGISIHALLAESDWCISRSTPVQADFYPRSPCGERPPLADGAQAGAAFLSTLSLRRATRHWQTGQSRTRHFYPRSPCGERRKRSCAKSTRSPHFYPRSPCGERRCISRKQPVQAAFLSTLSLRRATHISDYVRNADIFLSTLSLRRATSALLLLALSPTDFYPRSPCGERQKTFETDLDKLIFLSTLSLRRATVSAAGKEYDKEFLSTLSLRRATWCRLSPLSSPKQISIHALLAESDRTWQKTNPNPRIFLSTLSLRRATLNGTPPLTSGTNFYPRSPCGERQ